MRVNVQKYFTEVRQYSNIHMRNVIEMRGRIDGRSLSPAGDDGMIQFWRLKDESLTFMCSHEDRVGGGGQLLSLGFHK